MNDKENVIEQTGIYKRPYPDKFWDKNDVWFELSDEKMQCFMDASSYEDQQQILEAFFDAVMESIKKYF